VRPWTLWRYRTALPAPLDDDSGWEQRVSLGEGGTPVLPLDADGRTWLKVESMNPTGSFKDRGAAVLIATALAAGASRVVVDSSGNAGAAAAAYCARVGLPCEVYVPASASPGKSAQIAAYGAVLHRVEGTREDVAAAARQAVASTGAFHASHVDQPAFTAGVATMAIELWEQMDPLPPEVVVPVGNGSLLLGLASGFAHLADAGLIPEVPRLIGVQAAACSPVAAAWSGHDPATGVHGPTIAEGIAIAQPRRLSEIVATAAEMITVTDDQITAARADLAHHGLWAEPTAAVAYAGSKTRPPTPRVVVLTGHGLKSPVP
jgi:threonine synthase